MNRRPEVSIGLALAVATIVLAINAKGIPTQADVRVGKPGEKNLEAVRKQNAWVSAGVVSGISLLAKDPTIFIVGGATVVALDWLTRINNWNDPVTGIESLNPFRADMRENGDVVSQNVDTSYSNADLMLVN